MAPLSLAHHFASGKEPMLRRLTLAIAITAAASGPSWAETAASYSVRSDLVSIYRQAVSNNADLAAARAQSQATREVVPQARAGLLPNLSAGAELSDTRTDADSNMGTRSLSRSGTVYQAT